VTPRLLEGRLLAAGPAGEFVLAPQMADLLFRVLTRLLRSSSSLFTNGVVRLTGEAAAASGG
jgi:hypothetical protein